MHTVEIFMSVNMFTPITTSKKPEPNRFLEHDPAGLIMDHAYRFNFLCLSTTIMDQVSTRKL